MHGDVELLVKWHGKFGIIFKPYVFGIVGTYFTELYFIVFIDLSAFK